MAIDKKTEKLIIDLLSVLLPDAKIYLFGSRARGTAHTWSDVDLALDAGGRLMLNEVAQAKEVIEALHIPYKVELVDIHAISPQMLEEIKRDRILWRA